MSSVALAIGRFGTLDEMLDNVLAKVLKVVQTDAGSVYLLDDERGELTLAVSQGLSEEARRDFDRLKLGEGLSAGCPGRRPDRHPQPQGRSAPHPDGGPRRGLPRVRLRTASFQLQDLRHAQHPFTVRTADYEEDVQLLTAMASQIGSAVSNARLYLGLQASERKFVGWWKTRRT